MKPKAVQAYCREKGIKAFDLRFVDVQGEWRHVTFPVSSLTEACFEEGFAHDVVLIPNGPSHQPKRTHAVLVPNSEANYVDWFTSQPTLVLLTSIQDSFMREDSPLDSRHVALQSVRYFESMQIGDGISVRPHCQFRIQRHQELSRDSNPFMACGHSDQDFVLRCEIADMATESGFQIDHHYCGEGGCSEIVLKPTSLVKCCDDIMMLRYLFGQHASRSGLQPTQQDLWLPSQWTFTRQGEPILAGSAYRGMSELGLHALGGVLKHSNALAAIALANQSKLALYPWLRLCSDSSQHSLARIVASSNNPRSRAIEFRGTPASANPYLMFSAILMAMIDGIQNKTSPGSAIDASPTSEADSSKWSITSSETTRQELRDWVASDRDFLLRGEVFSEELLEAIFS